MRIAPSISFAFLAALLAVLAGCGEPAERPELAELRAQLPELFEATEEGFADALLRIRSRERRPDGTTRLKALASVEGAVVGLQIDLGSEWSEAEFGDGLTLLRGTLALRSIGKESDRLLKALAAAYGIEPPAATLRPILTLAAIALDGDPRDLDAGRVHMKVFHEPDVYGSELSEVEVEAIYERFYAEAYLNVDLGARTLEIAEKDEAYRAPLLTALSAERGTETSR